ncbi:PadR family transcriptional regulator [Mycobacterium sp. BMJ-28]
MEDSEPAGKLAMSATGWALLGMLSYDTELSGYDIRKWIHWSMRYYYGSPAFSQIYSELKKLEKMGLLTSRVDGSGTRNRRLYKITQTGSDAVTRWARDTPLEPPSLKHPAILRVTLGHLSDPETLKAMLHDHIAYVDEMHRDAAKEARWAAEDPSWAYAKIALEWAERYYASERELTLKLIKDLDEAQANFPKVGEGAKIPWPDPEYWYEIEKRAEAEDAG